MSEDRQTNVLIMGAAGKDFHVFNTCYRNQSDKRVVGFTAAQIPHIDDRTYPAELAGDQYPDGVPIYPEDRLTDLIEEKQVDEVVFAYSDVSRSHLEECRKKVENAGASFHLSPVEEQYLTSEKPVVAVCAVRTGAGKSQTSRHVADLLRENGRDVAVVRHPMPYGDLAQQAVQRFASLDDMKEADCTIEEMEEYEPHLQHGNVVFAGVDYDRVLRKAEEEADVILWDGGNNDTPFLAPDVHVVVCDPLRAGHELNYYPGWVNFERADVLVINKVDSAEPEQVNRVEENARRKNASAKIIRAESPVSVDDPGTVDGKRVVCVEDGPTLTHGEMETGAAFIAARQFGAEEIVDPRPHAVGSIQETYEAYDHIGPILPAMGYGDEQRQELEETLRNAPADLILLGTPVDLSRIIEVEQPVQRVTYELDEIGSPNLREVLDDAGLL